MTATLRRFGEKFVVLDNGCWMWVASLNMARGGYAQFSAGGTMVRAHRYAYETLIGPVPDGLDLDHLCRNRWCVNPAHLEPVTRSENLRRGYAARGLASTCAQNHPFDESNTFQRADGGRGCRACRNDASRASKARARAASRGDTNPAQTNPA